MNELEININEFAQEKLAQQEIVDWFESQNIQKQSEILNHLHWFIINSKPTNEEIEIAIINSNLKVTYTPIILIRNSQINIAIPKILDLPQNEWKKSFILLIEMFKTSDIRRRQTDCKEGCDHEWHNLNIK